MVCWLRGPQETVTPIFSPRILSSSLSAELLCKWMVSEATLQLVCTTVLFLQFWIFFGFFCGLVIWYREVKRVLQKGWIPWYNPFVLCHFGNIKHPWTQFLVIPSYQNGTNHWKGCFVFWIFGKSFRVTMFKFEAHFPHFFKWSVCVLKWKDWSENCVLKQTLD